MLKASPASAKEYRAEALDSLLTTQNDNQIVKLKQALTKRNKELAQIALYLKNVEETQSAQQRDSLRLSQTLQEANDTNGLLNQQIDLLKESLGRQRVSSAIANKSYQRPSFSDVDKQLLHDFSRTRIPEDDIRRMALETGLFNARWYCGQYGLPELDEAAALEHYLTEGHGMGHNPSTKFDGSYYSAQNTDINDGISNPLRHYIQFGVCEQRPVAAMETPLRVRIIMMQRNEADLIYPWALFHGLRFGFENLHIIDNGSEKSFNSRLEFLESIGVRISRQYNRKEDFINKGGVVSDVIKQYDADEPADFYFPMDCDEFLGVELADGTPSFSGADICNELAQHYKTPGSLAVATYYDNHPAVAGKFKRVPGQRKTFFSQGSCESLDRGFNHPKAKTGGGKKKTAIVYVHFHFKPFPLLRVHARQRLSAFLDDFSDEALRMYIKEKNSGFHSAHHLLMPELDYLSRDMSQYKDLPNFVNAFDELGMPLPFSEWHGG